MTQDKQTWLASLERSVALEIIKEKHDALAFALTVANERLEQAQTRADRLEERLYDVTTVLADLARMSGTCSSGPKSKAKLPPLRLINPVKLPHSKERLHHDA